MGARAVRYYVAEDNTQLLFTYKTCVFAMPAARALSDSAIHLRMTLLFPWPLCMLTSGYR